MSELMEHMMQDCVQSKHIKALKDNLLAIRQVISERRDGEENQSVPATPQMPRIIPRCSGFGGDKSEVLKMAFVLSKFNHVFFNNMFGLQLNQTEVFEMVASILEVKSSTLRNYRDAFDNHVKQVNTDKPRQGWKKELTTDLQVVKETFDPYKEEEMQHEIRKTLENAYPDIDMVIKIAYGFLFASKGIRTQFNISYNGTKLNAIVAPHTDRIAYMVFLGFGNTLQKGIYPAIYVYRRYGKVFTVYGESVTNSPNNHWNTELDGYNKIRQHFSDNEVNELSRLTHDYLENIASKEFALDSSEESSGVYKLNFAQNVVDNLKKILSIYVEQYS